METPYVLARMCDLNLYFFGRGIHNSGPYEYILVLYDSMIQHRPAEAMIQNSVDQVVDPVQNPASKFPPVRHSQITTSPFHMCTTTPIHTVIHTPVHTYLRSAQVRTRT